MSEVKPPSSDLVMTQAELPPGIDAPQAARERMPGDSIPDDVDNELRRLAERVGGMVRLREMINIRAMGDC